MSTRQLLGIIGSILLFIGVFLPILSIPIVGNVNYFQNGRGDGVIILVLAVLSCVFALINDYRKLWFTGLGSLAVMLFTFINFHLKMAETKAQMESSLAGNPFRGLADLAIQSVQLQWGWAILLLGAALVIAAAAMKEEGGTEQDTIRSKKCPFCAEVIKAEAILCKHCGRDQPTPVVISSTGETAQWEDCHKFERASSIKLKSRVLQFEKNYAFALYPAFCSVLVLLFLGYFHIYYGGDVGLQISPKTRFGFEDTIVDLDKVSPENRRQLIDAGIMPSKGNILTDKAQKVKIIDDIQTLPPKNKLAVKTDVVGKSTAKETRHEGTMTIVPDAIQKVRENRGSVEKRLALHENERKQFLEEYERRRDLYYRGLMIREEVLQTESALAEALIRVDEDKRSLAEMDSALREYQSLRPGETNR